MKPIAITTGEPAGIGPQISLRAALAVDLPLVLLGDADWLEATAGRLALPWPLPRRIAVESLALAVPALPGLLDARNAAYVLGLLDRAISGCLAGEFRALATAPVQKSVIADSGVAFTGHTEYLAARTGTAQVVMLLVAEGAEAVPGSGEVGSGLAAGGGAAETAGVRERGSSLRVALATTHLPLSEVPAAITRAGLLSTLEVMDHDLRQRFGITAPRIAVTGLNPHAGEGGHLGREEIDTIAPAIATARARGIDAVGPLPADTVFVAAQLARFDAVLAMYHDQGLPVLKHASFGHAVNVTLGLPFVRTSVDHGTALDLAATGGADAGSLIEAIRLADRLSRRER